MNLPAIGIDLGTTNSVVAVADGARVRAIPDAQGEALIPSVVSFHPNGEIVVGRGARDRRLLDAQNTVYSVKRLIGRPFRSEAVQRAARRFPFELQEGPNGGVMVAARGETYSLSEISAFVLRQVRAQAEENLGRSCGGAVITVPANFNELQRNATKAAGRVAGLEVLRILNEPTAAALAYGYGRGSQERIAIYDLGGGTFDLTILDLAGDVFEVVATAGDTYLGGDDIDSLIAERMADAFLEHHRYDLRPHAQAFERLRMAAEWAKCRLSDEEQVQVRVEELAYGADGTPLDLAFRLTRADLEARAHTLLARTFDVCEDAMRVAGLRPSQLDNVILVGGSTRMPRVRAMVTEYFGREPLAKVHPDLVVAYGAAIQARALSTPRTARAVAKVPLKKVRAPRQTQQGYPPPLPPVEDELSDEPTKVHRSSAPPAPIHEQPTVVSPVPPAPDARRSSSRPPPVPPDAAARSGSSVPPAPAERSGAHKWSSAPPPSLPQGAGKWSSAPPVPGLGAAAADTSPEPPLLLDVTPQSLSVETVGGYCEPIIGRNAAIPAEQTRAFSTARDDQETVRVQICQGESRRLEENQVLGEIQLTGLRPAPRGTVQVAVSFIINADGILEASARDVQTGDEQRVRIQLIGGLDEEEVRLMQQRQQALTGE